MIYLDSSNIIIPNLLNVASSTYRVVLKNNVTNLEVTLDAMNLSDNSFYYSFSLHVSNLSPNEYTVVLYSDSSLCLGTFLAQKGIQTDIERTTFENDTEYIQFDPDILVIEDDETEPEDIENDENLPVIE